MQPLISVIIPIYNMEDYLCECVDSVLNQSYPNLEVILVNDGSTDACGRICDQYAEKDSRVVVVHKENGGLSSARNAGLASASGDYITFVDSDDYIVKGLYEKVVDVFRKENVDIVEFGIILSNEQGAEIGTIESKRGKFTDKTEVLTLLLQNQLQNYLPNKVFARHVFEGISFPVGYVWEDIGTTYKLLRQAEGVCSIPEKLYYYRQREKSIIHDITSRALRDIFTMQKQRYDDLVDSDPDVAILALPLVADSAIRLYDRSLWEEVDRKAYEDALAFLTQHKAKLLSETENVGLKCYYWNKALYSRIRILRHMVGSVVKSIYKAKQKYL